MLKFLLDANISYETANFLNSLGYDTKTVVQFGLAEAEDIEIVNTAIREKRIIITLDSDFGEIFYFSSKEKFWIIVLKLKKQTVESVNKTLGWFLKTKILEKKKFQNTLMIIESSRVRVRQKKFRDY